MDEDKVILLVEDNPNDEELTKMAFQRNMIRNPIVVTRDGAEALDFIYGTGNYSNRNMDNQPKVVILDLKLPKVNGFEVLRTMRNDVRTRMIPVVVLTTSDAQEDLFQAYNLGTNAYVRKPVDFHEFSEAVEKLSRFWLTLNQTISRPILENPTA